MIPACAFQPKIASSEGFSVELKRCLLEQFNRFRVVSFRAQIPGVVDLIFRATPHKTIFRRKRRSDASYQSCLAAVGQ